METLLNRIPFSPDVSALLDHLHLRPNSAYAVEFQSLLAQAQKIARPKALVRVAYVAARGADSVRLDDVTLTSRILAVNLAQAERAFPFLATCGRELQTWAEGMDDMLRRFWADAIQESALRAALEAVESHVSAAFSPGHLSAMNPGSLEDWPLTQQQELFAFFPDHPSQIGIELTPSFLMIPTKSVSGLFFPTETTFENCMLCNRPNCPNRHAPYDPALYEARYAD